MDAGFQCAILYTTMFGVRRIRVINISIPATQLIVNVYKLAEIDTIVLLLAKMGLHQVSSTMMSKIRFDISKRITAILRNYRKKCASSANAGQLILPESLKLLPVLACALLKTTAMKGGSSTTIDEKVYAMRVLRGVGVASSIPLIYPRMTALHDLPANVSFFFFFFLFFEY